MGNWPNNKGKHWTPEQKTELRNLAQGNTPTRVIALKTGRTAEAIYAKASELGVPLKPTNQSPYGKKKN